MMLHQILSYVRDFWSPLVTVSNRFKGLLQKNHRLHEMHDYVKNDYSESIYHHHHHHHIRLFITRQNALEYCSTVLLVTCIAYCKLVYGSTLRDIDPGIQFMGSTWRGRRKFGSFALSGVHRQSF